MEIMANDADVTLATTVVASAKTAVAAVPEVLKK
jgi:hypothetical protein